MNNEATAAEIRQLAQEVAAGGFSYQVDGPKLLMIISLLGQQVELLPHLQTPEKKGYVLCCLVALDQEYGWDALNMNDATEVMFYRYFVDFYFR